jgi:hypothetical protein
MNAYQRGFEASKVKCLDLIRRRIEVEEKTIGHLHKNQRYMEEAELCAKVRSLRLLLVDIEREVNLEEETT